MQTAVFVAENPLNLVQL